MKKLAILFALLLNGCISIELPNLVSDTVKVGKDAYQATLGEKPAPAADPTTSKFTLAHSYIGKESQTVAQIKQQCVDEASVKLNQIAGKPVRNIVAQNEIMTLNSNVVANCKLVAENE